MAYGIAVGTAKHGSAIAPWKIVFLVTGLLTICMGVTFLFVVPDNQMNARWLSKEDRLLAIERIRVNQQGVGNKHWKFYQLKEALLDPLTWAFFFYALVADIPNGMTSTYSVSSLGVPNVGTCNTGRDLGSTVIERLHRREAGSSGRFLLIQHAPKVTRGKFRVRLTRDRRHYELLFLAHPVLRLHGSAVATLRNPRGRS